MYRVNIFEVKAKLSEYLDRVARGEQIIICRHNKPIAELRPIAAALTEPRTIGPIPGRPAFSLSPSFFEPLPADGIEQWEGGVATDPLSPGWPASSRGATRVAERRTRPTRSPHGKRPPRRRS